MKTPVYLLCVMLLSTAALGGFEEKGCGLAPWAPREVPGLLTEVRDIPVLPGRPACDSVDSIDLSHQMPPVGDQQRQNSCAAWAAGYHHWTHEQWLDDTTRDVTDSHYQMSPAFIYNQINGGANGMVDVEALFGLVCEQGCASLVDCPYDQNDYTTWPTEQAFVSGLPYRAAEGHWIDLGDTGDLTLLKQHLCNGHTAVLAIWVWANFDNIHNFEYTYCACERYGGNRGLHAVTLVGYNNQRVTSDGVGAFRLVNSWGTDWGDSGYFWMSYVAVLDSFLSYYLAGYMDDRDGYEPKLVGRLFIDHGQRDGVGIRLGAGSTDSALWQYDYRSWRSPVAHRPFPYHNIVFDMTDAAPFLESRATDSLFAGCIDDVAEGDSGRLLFFQADDMDTVAARSPDPPVYIPDGGDYAYARLQIGWPSAVEGESQPTVTRGLGSAVVAGGKLVFHGQRSAALLDAAGRQVLILRPGTNDVSRVAPGVYFAKLDAKPHAQPSVCRVLIAK